MGYTFKQKQAQQGEGRAEARREDAPGVVEFAETRLGFFPDESQKRLLRTRVKRGMVKCTRQWGKSTVAAVMAVHRSYFQAKSLVVVACPTEKQSAELVWKARRREIEWGTRRLPGV